ncbi:MAG: phosphoribosyltransferase [Promethearchaeota archaeon]
MAVTHKFVDWEQCHRLCLELYKKVTESGYQSDVIVGMGRGGWVPARIFADMFTSQQIANVKVEFYNGIYSTSKRPRITQPASSDLQGKKVLLIDDISDTGRSMMTVVEHLKHQKVADLRTVTLHVKPWTKLRPDFYGELTKAWIVYPWDLKEFIFAFANQLSEKHVPLLEIEKQLKKIGLPTQLTREFFQQWQSTQHAN